MRFRFFILWLTIGACGIQYLDTWVICGVRSPKFIWAPVNSYTHWLRRPRNPRIWANKRGRYWSANIGDILDSSLKSVQDSKYWAYSLQAITENDLLGIKVPRKRWVPEKNLAPPPPPRLPSATKRSIYLQHREEKEYGRRTYSRKGGGGISYIFLLLR